MDVVDQSNDNAKRKRKKKKAEKRAASESEQERHRKNQDDYGNLPSSSSSHMAPMFTSLKEFRKQKMSESSEDFASKHKKKRKKHKKDKPETITSEVASESEKFNEGAAQSETGNDNSIFKILGENTNVAKKKKKKKKVKPIKEIDKEIFEIQSKNVENAFSGEEVTESRHKSKHKKKKKKRKHESNKNDLSANEITLDMLDNSNAESISELADKIARESSSNISKLRSTTPNHFSRFNEDSSQDIDDLPSTSKWLSKASASSKKQADSLAQSKGKAPSKTKRTKKPAGNHTASAVNTSLQNKDTGVSEENPSAFNIDDMNLEDGSQTSAIGMDDPEVQTWLKSLDHDMVEEELDFEPPELHKRVPVLRGASAKDKEELKKDGINVRLGKWSPKEDLIIKENLEFIAEKYQVPAAHILLGINRKSKEKMDSKLIRYLQLKKFSFQLAKNLPNRTLFSTYLRARKVFHPMSKAKLNKEQRSQMLRLKDKVGHKWNNISEKMNVPAHVLREAARYHMEKRDSGLWTNEENDKLVEAVGEKLHLCEDGSCRKLPWKEIAKKVGTRDKGQCCKQWLHHLCWKFAHGKKVKPNWTDQDSYRLVEHLYQLDAETEADVDWDAICRKFSSSGSPSTKKTAAQDE